MHNAALAQRRSQYVQVIEYNYPNGCDIDGEFCVNDESEEGTCDYW